MKKALDRWWRLTYKEKIRQLESGSGSGGTVGSEVSTAVGRAPSGTFARLPQGVAIRLNDLIMPRRMGRAHRHKRFRISSMICTRWYLMRSKNTWRTNQERPRNVANQNYGKSVVQKRGQYADKNWTIRCRE